MREQIAAFGMKGYYRDVLYDAYGVLTFDSLWCKNTVVICGRQLLASLMRREPGTLGIEGLLVGRGNPAWDSAASGAPPVDPIVHTTLEDKSPYLVSPVVFNYVDSMGAASPISTTTNRQQVTNRLQIVATLGPKVPNWTDVSGSQLDSTLREFALVGTLAGDQVLVNNVRHVAIPKDSMSTLVRTIQLVF